MLYWLAAFSDTIGPLNVLRYITFRTGGAMVTALVCVLLFGPWITGALRRNCRAVHPAGPIILSVLLAATLLWANPGNPYVWIAIGVTLSFGLIGIVAKGRLAIATIVATAACLALVHLGRQPTTTSLGFPFGQAVDLGWFYVPVGALVIVAAGNIVNLADRLYGSVITPVLIAALSFSLIAYLVGNSFFAEYLDVRYVPGSGELAVLGGAGIGAGLGFLWLNAPPASTFAGDAASLALGGMLGTVAVATKQEVVLVLICCLCVLIGPRPNLTMNG
jgi:phospho-N-acetylmuramoyl-pentapeptide-transferase